MAHFDTYLVGGAVRDLLLGRESQDRDYVVVGATPEDMAARGYKQVGADFPVFLHPTTGDEYALARTERKTGKGYHGFAAEFGKDVTLEDDLRRRDLTMNAMALRSLNGSDVLVSSSVEIVDPYGGRADLEAKVLRHVSEAFAEDPLRVLRVARFAARYAFSVAPETLELCRSLVTSGELATVSNERMWKEMDRALSEPHPEKFFEVLESAGALWNKKVPFFYECFKDKGRLEMALHYKVKPTTVYGYAGNFAGMDSKKLQRLKVPNDAARLALVYGYLDKSIAAGSFSRPDGADVVLWLKMVPTEELMRQVQNCVMLDFAGDAGFYICGMLDDCKKAFDSVKAGELMAADPKLEGKAIGQAVDKLRAERVAHAISHYEW